MGDGEGDDFETGFSKLPDFRGHNVFNLVFHFLYILVCVIVKYKRSNKEYKMIFFSQKYSKITLIWLHISDCFRILNTNNINSQDLQHLDLEKGEPLMLNGLNIFHFFSNSAVYKNCKRIYYS